MGVLLIPKYISQDNALKISAALGIVFSLCIINTQGSTSVFFVAALGVANALVWPAVWPLTLKGLGSFTKTASALLVMAISGGAIIPLLYGRLVDNHKYDLIASGVSEANALSTASTSSYWILLPCYVLILYYALSGHKLGVKKRN
jgi:fucose permease